jgi:signal transduction histidine kinase
LFGIEGLDPVVHAVFWSVTLNSLVFVCVSLVTFPNPVERLQGAQFVNVFAHSRSAGRWTGNAAQAEDLLIMSQRIIGPREAQTMFQNEAIAQGRQGYLPDVTPDFIGRLERALAGNVGAATAHAMLGQIVGGASVSVQDLMAVADETAQMLEYSNQLEAKSGELARTARQLRDANEKLTEISIQKDAFLSQISHELRTPMTSIRAFSEILRSGAGELEPKELEHYAGIIHDESRRLTRLLDDLLDLSVLENGQVNLNIELVELAHVLSQSIQAVNSSPDLKRLLIVRDADSIPIHVATDPDRLSQVFINIIANAGKYCDAPDPELRIAVSQTAGHINIDFIDNGSGIPKKSQALIFEKFSRLSDQAAAGGAGLGLAICREIMVRLGGSISYLPGQGGTAFRVTLPLVNQQNAASGLA